jgi:hypothetical protein
MLAATSLIHRKSMAYEDFVMSSDVPWLKELKLTPRWLESPEMGVRGVLLSESALCPAVEHVNRKSYPLR